MITRSYVNFRLFVHIPPLPLLAAFGLWTAVLPLETRCALGQTAVPSLPTESLIVYKPDVERFPKKLQPLISTYIKGVTLAESSNPDKSKKQFYKAKTTAQQNLKSLTRGYYDELYFFLGLAYEGLEENDKALSAYDKSFEYRHRNPLVIFRQAFVLKKMGKCEKALPKFEEVRWLTRKAIHEVFYLSAECHRTLGDRDKAMNLLKKAWAVNPQYLPTLKSLVALRSELFEIEEDRTKKAQLKLAMTMDLVVIIQLDPNDRESALRLGRILLEQSDPLLSSGRLLEAGRLGKLFAEKSNYSDVESVRLLFDAQVKRRNLAGAENTLKRGLAVTPSSKSLQEAAQQLQLERNVEG